MPGGICHFSTSGVAGYFTRNTFRQNGSQSISVALDAGEEQPFYFCGNIVEDNVATEVTSTILVSQEPFGEICYNIFRHNTNIAGGTIYIVGTTNVRIHHNIFEGNMTLDSEQGSIVHSISSGQVTLDSNWIAGNNSQTITCDQFEGCSIDAQNNYWGAPSGPYHPTLNPGGQGDTLWSDSVLFIPWLTAPPDTALPNAIQDHERPMMPRTWELLDVYPNPFNASLQIVLAGFTGNDFEITLHNLLGQRVDVIHRGALTGGQLAYLPSPLLSSGVYFVNARDRQGIQTRKVVLLK
jgi:hypothetical protein